MKRLVRSFQPQAWGALVLLALLTPSAHAALQYTTGSITWDNGTTSAWSGASGGPYTATWTSGNDAVFEGPAGTVTVAGAGATAATLRFDTTGYTVQGGILTVTGAHTITAGAIGNSATISAPLAGTTGVQVEGSGTVNFTGISTITGGGTGSLGLVVGQTSGGNTVNLSSGGTMGTSSTNRRALWVGGSTFGNNSVTISTPGNAGTPTFDASGNGAQGFVGVSSSNNSLLINNGAYVAQSNGGGTNTWNIGTNAGANSNSITVTGTSSTINFGSNQFLNVGVAGDSNSLTVSNGGTFNLRRLGIGTNGGDNNDALVTGLGSTITMTNTSNNGFFQIGITAASLNNRFRIENGATATFSNTGGITRQFSIGQAAGADGNYILVKDAGSTFSVNHSQPVVIGGQVVSNTVTDTTAANNHIDVYSGGALNLSATTSLYVMGSNSAVNLGNGTGTSTMTVGANSGLTAGVFLKNASSQLNFNAGTLTAAANGALVSGPGLVQLNGPAAISSSFAASAISSQVTGNGTLTKQGSGTLILSNSSNNYSGNTFITAGTLLANNASGSATGSGNVSVTGATLGGTGGVSGVVTLNNAGVLSPGSSIESLSTGSLNFTTGSALNYELLTSALDGDLVGVTGNLSLTGDVSLNLLDLDIDTALPVGSKLSLISYTGNWDGGTFTGFADDSTFTLGSNLWKIDYNDTVAGANLLGGGAGPNYVTMTVAALPEPGTLVLLGLGGIALGAARWRRKSVRAI